MLAEIVYPLLVVLCGYVVLGITGFGSALIIVPMLAWRWPLHEVVPLTLLLDAPASALQGGLNIRAAQIREAGTLLPGIGAGAALGLWLAGLLDPRWPLVALGIYVAIVGIRSLIHPKGGHERPANAWVYPAGVAIGTVEVLFGTAGPLVVAWLSRRIPNTHSLRATTPLVLVICAGIALIGMGLAGNLSQSRILFMWGSLIWVAILGVLAGNQIARHLDPSRLRQIICALLTFSGLSLAVHAWAH